MPEGKPGGGHLGGGVRGWLRAFAWKDAKPKEKRQANQSLGVELWWSRGELNPRPQALRNQFYMRSRPIWI